MSDASATAVSEPNVAKHGGYTDAASEFASHHSGGSAAEAPVQKLDEQSRDTSINKEEKVSKKDVKITAEPVTSGTLGYKAPGIISALKSFKPHYFWLGDEPVHHKQLTQYLRGEKQQDAAHANAAWSSKTGKGLLYFSKSESDKKTPGGILNLSDVYEVAKEGLDEFSFRLHKHKHVFKAKSQEERNGWVVALEKDRETANNTKKDIQESSGYKEHISQLGGTAAVGAGAAGSGVAASKAHDSSDTKAAETAKESKDQKSRSASRGNKRQSILGTMKGKKEERDEKKEEKKEDKALDKQQKEQQKAEESKGDEMKAAAVADSHNAELMAKSEDKEDKKALADQKDTEAKDAKKELKASEKAEKEHEKDIKKEEKSEDKAAKASDKHGKEAVGAGAAAITAAGTAEAIHEGRESKKEEEKKTETPSKDTSKANKRRSMFGGLFGGSKSPEPEKSQPKTPEPTASEATTGAAGVSGTKTTAPVDVFASDPVSAEGSSAPLSESAQSPLTGVFKDDPVSPETSKTSAAKDANLTTAKPATAGTSPGEKRRSGFFGLGSMKKSDRPSETSAGTDSDTTDNEGTKSGKQASSGFSNIFRRPSKNTKSTPTRETEKKTATPAAVPEEGSAAGETKSEAAAIGTDGASESKLVPAADEEPKAQATIGDVVPDAVSIGEKQDTPKPVSTAA
ncbi:MAG: hypothetical protein M1828_002986 [Chrysothrix sp. TS-e1954]|nr:MAG: hypothetical protein M1828_002986 [Chrysothrix sp. TS-e1954]